MAVASPDTAVQAVQTEALKVADPELSGNKLVSQRMLEVKNEKGVKAALKDARDKKYPKGIEDTKRTSSVEASIEDSRPADRAEATTALDTANEYVTKGIDSLTPDKANALQTEMLGELNDTPWLKDMISSMSPDRQKTFATALLKDSGFQAVVNRQMHDLVNSPVTEALKKSKVEELMKADATLTAAGALIEATVQLQDEWAKKAKNVVTDSAAEYFRDRLDEADDVSKNEGKDLDKKAKDLEEQEAKKKGEAAVDGVAELFRKRWKQRGMLRGNDPGKGDFDAYAKGGLEAVFQRADIPPAQQRAILDNPELKKQYESQFAENALNERLRLGKLNKTSIYDIVDNPAMGDTQEARVQKLQGMMETHKQLQQLIKDKQASGDFQRDLWDKMKGLSPSKKRNAMTALLALLFLPAAAVGTVVRHEMGA